MENSSDACCQNCDKCYEILKLIVDNQASDEQQKYFSEHAENCLHCLREYNLEREIKQMLRQQSDRQEVPSDLIDTIRTAILSTP